MFRSHGSAARKKHSRLLPSEFFVLTANF